ncbi:MAG: methyltransferase domain-containing protein [Pseudomonadota bacterium]|nr:methyltransferase domain-containing protein [Pseudomonadota bacterium]
MYNDVIDLQNFYSSPLGHTAQRIVRRYIRGIWPDTRAMSVAAIGYPLPYLRPFMEEAERVVVLMPPQQGVMRWPTGGRNIVSLAPEDELPLPDVSMDRILLVHALECSEQPRALLREVWRSMTAGGRVLIVIPNRRGIWARVDQTPFGHGHPYTSGQLSRLLRDNLFQTENSLAGLFVPPMQSRMALTAARPIERLGVKWFQTVGGVLLLVAQKQIYAGSETAITSTKSVRRGSYARVAGGTKTQSSEKPRSSAPFIPASIRRLPPRPGY